jgi:hypothetical protein
MQNQRYAILRTKPGDPKERIVKRGNDSALLSSEILAYTRLAPHCTYRLVAIREENGRTSWGA